MKKVACVVCLMLAVSIAVFAAEPLSQLSSVALEHMGLNSVPEAVAPPYAPPMLNEDVITWVAEPNCLNTINRAACGKIGNYVYIFGGQGSGGGATHVAFNITTEQWVSSTAPGVSGSNWSSAVANGAMYLFPSGSTQTTVQKFTPEAGGPLGTWSLAAMYPISAWAHAVGWDGGNYIYCAGGSAFSPMPPMVANAYRFNLTTNAFDTLAPLPEGRGYVGGAFCSGKFYVLGGDNTSYQYTSTCYEYDPTANTWTTKAPLILATAFGCFNTITDGQKIYLVGGGGGNATSLPSTDTIQVYDPATDVWSIETNRMNNYGTNAAAYVPEGNWIFDCGGRIMTTSYNVTWRGNMTAAPPQLDVTLALVPPPPPPSINFTATVVNHGPQAPFWVWARIRYPDGTYTTPTLGPVQINPPVEVAVSRPRTFVVPGGWPAGLYYYLGYANWTFSYPAVDSSWFTFIVTTGGDNPFEPVPYTLGEPFPGEVFPVNAQPSAHDLCTVSPNPFNPTTAINYQLSTFSQVNLKVYDTAGRLIATLVDGWRDAGSHQVTFDGSNLASGVYLYRLESGGTVSVGKIMLLK